MFDHLAEEATKVLEQTYGLKDVFSGWEVPKEASRGDRSTSVALRVARSVGRTPMEVAHSLADALRSSSFVARIEAVEPGYVNVWFTPAVLLNELSAALAACAPQAPRKEAPVVVDYSAPNIAKPLGIHHILSTVIGQSIVNLHKHLGYSTIADNHIGDWGTQFGKLAVGFERWGTKPLQEHTIDDLLALYVRFHEEAEKDPAFEDAGRLAFAQLEAGDSALRAFWEEVVSITMRSMEDLYRRLSVTFDVTLGESFYEERMASILEEGKKKGVFVEGEEGALIVLFPEESKLPPAIVVKKDGSTNYLTRDLATIRYRIDTWHPQAIYYVVDVAQSLYFQQLFATVEQLGWELPALEHVLFGRMRFADKKMSTRKGTILKLEEVLDEAVRRARELIESRGDAIQTDDPAELARMMGTGAVVYEILSQNRKMDIVFDWDKMLTFEGNSAPYLQYTHARARSVLRKAEMEKGEWSNAAMTSSFSEHERRVVLHLLQFPDVLSQAAAEHLPHTLAHFLYELCQIFNAFYNVDSILQAEPITRAFRLSLTAAVADVLRAGASILTLRLPDRM